MITKNGALLLTHIRLLQEAATGLIKTDGTAASSQSVSNSQYLFKQCSKLNLQNSVDSASQGGMVMNLGVGTTPPSKEDYWLAQTEIDGGVDVNTVITCQNTVPWNPSVLENGNIAYTYTFLNTGNDAIIVNEIGLSFVATTGKFLVGRKIIPARRISAGETVTFTYTINFD